jgi:serine/threonine-protein kinase
MQTAEAWLHAHGECETEPIAKETQTTRAWFARLAGQAVFAKCYPHELRDTWARKEREIAGANLHPAIVPLRQIVACSDGDLFVYPRVDGENLGPMDTRTKFARLPIPERTQAVLTVAESLAAVCEAGHMVVDWYEGNMIYNFAQKQIWLFDWELCQDGAFTLQMDSNYGSSRLMAPEEFIRGSRLTEQTLVYNVGRYALLNLPELAEELAPLLALATYPSRTKRYATIREFARALGSNDVVKSWLKNPNPNQKGANFSASN